ncbi:MAG: TonB-dependent receptor plug domain-containing protein [Bacteroidetes bacterium]|nr:TonB-dependent receptor plug domain-containing protein [Bacteroidota bacterium]
MMKCKLLCAMLFFSSLASHAQQSLLEKGDTLRNIELPLATIRESKGNRLDDFSAKKINKKTLTRLNQGQDIPHLLSSLSSVVSYSDAGVGTGYTGIRIRGADLTRINVTMNGIPVNDAESQATYFVNTPDMLSSTQQLEVSKGVGISKSGVGNFGAGIAINNLDIQYRDPMFSYQTDFGSFGTFKNTLKASTGLLHEKFVATVRLSTIKSRGFIERSNSNLKAAQFTAKYAIDAKTQLIFNYMKGYEKTGQAWNGVPQDSLQTNRTYNELGVKSDGSFYDNQTDNYGQDYYQLFLDRQLNQRWAVGSILFLTKGKVIMKNLRRFKIIKTTASIPTSLVRIPFFSTTDLIRQLWLDNDFFGVKMYATYLSKKVDAGFYFNANRYQGKHFGEIVWAQQGINKGYRWYDLSATKSEINGYSMLDYRPANHLSIFADMQIREVRYILNGFRRNPTLMHDLHFTFFNPKIKGTFKKQHHLASLLVGIAQKEPNRDDIEAGQQFLPKPEKLLNTELTYQYQAENGFRFQANAFGMFYRDQLVLTGKINDVGAYTRSNIDKSYRVGIELEFRYVSEKKFLELNANVAFSQNKILNFSEFIDDYDNGSQIEKKYRQTDISFSPNIVAGGRVSVFPFIRRSNSRFQNTSLDFLPKFVGRQYLDNTGNVDRSIQSYVVGDVILNSPIRLQNNSLLHLRLGVYNVWNKRYEANGYTFSYIYNQQQTTQNYYYPQAGIRWMLGLGISL